MAERPQQRQQNRHIVQPQPQPQQVRQLQETASLGDWLQEARKGYVPKTAEQLQREYAVMTFEQLRARAGPPPTVASGDYGGWHAEEETGENGLSFDSAFDFFKQGRGPPPEPMALPCGFRDEGLGDMDGAGGDSKTVSGMARDRYAKWYDVWGTKLTEKWYEEHPRPAPKSKTARPKKTAPQEEPKEMTRVIVNEAGDKSGW